MHAQCSLLQLKSMWVAKFILFSSSTDRLKPLSTLQLRTIFVNDLPVWSQKPCTSLLCSWHLAACVSPTTLVPDIIGISLVRITAVSADGSKGKYCDTEIVSTHTKGWWVQLMANVVTTLPGNFEHIETIVKSNLVINCQCPGWRRPSHSFPVLLCRMEWMDAVCVWYGGDVCIHNLIETQYTKLCTTMQLDLIDSISPTAVYVYWMGFKCLSGSLVSRPLPDFISQLWGKKKNEFSPQLRDKIWEWPGNEAIQVVYWMSPIES